MARKVFFSFHFQRDVWRVGQVRNHWLTKPDRASAGYWDAAGWEEVKRKGDTAVQNWINNALHGTSVTCVLIGAQTSTREWVEYEIKQSHKIGNGIFGVYIHALKNKDGKTDLKGKNPFDNLTFKGVSLSRIYPTYYWNADKGYDNFSSWVEKAAKLAGR
jgi:hypothetical protein